MSVGFKNDINQAAELASAFDRALSEQCFQYDECGFFASFTQSGKEVLEVEYRLDPFDFCPQANALNFNALRKQGAMGNAGQPRHARRRALQSVPSGLRRLPAAGESAPRRVTQRGPVAAPEGATRLDALTAPCPDQREASPDGSPVPSHSKHLDPIVRIAPPRRPADPVCRGRALPWSEAVIARLPSPVPLGRVEMTTAGSLLVAGFVVFMAGAAAWKTGYQAPVLERMPLLHADRLRLRWIHSTMLVAMVLTPAGLAAATGVADHPAAWAAAMAYGVAAVPWMLQLTFRLTVQERVAESVAGGAPVPEWYLGVESWAGLGHRVHMVVSYAAAVPLAWGMFKAGLIPSWLAWAGAAWGAAWLVGFAIPRIRFAFEPPFWAHLFTFAVGIALL
jgi:hypothetical protein